MNLDNCFVSKKQITINAMTSRLKFTSPIIEITQALADQITKEVNVRHVPTNYGMKEVYPDKMDLVTIDMIVDRLKEHPKHGVDFFHTSEPQAKKIMQFFGIESEKKELPVSNDDLDFELEQLARDVGTLDDEFRDHLADKYNKAKSQITRMFNVTKSGLHK